MVTTKNLETLSTLVMAGDVVPVTKRTYSLNARPRRWATSRKVTLARGHHHHVKNCTHSPSTQASIGARAATSWPEHCLVGGIAVRGMEHSIDQRGDNSSHEWRDDEQPDLT